ncbi:hypothetical protein [Zoogloea sp.]|uniref:hypothetical protein n=1 Tax=Zoogloea sp. TaxID=49181 RepID=UPI002638187A|nr:hypothetical protein [Zoogloea sp.]MDD3353507.1 hypothetical protein [Zoogloea sp.]
MKRQIRAASLATALAWPPGVWAFDALPSLGDLRHAPHRDWLTLSGASHHFQPERRDWRETNPGLGFERELSGTPWVATAGYLRNSYDHHTAYLGGRWMPLTAGPLKAGLLGLLATGHPSPVLVLPTVSVQAGRIGANLIAVPNLPGYSGYLGIQLRLALE